MTAPQIYLVDDNAINVELVEFVLGSAGFSVESTTRAEQALDAIRSAPPDLVLMDIQMPGLDGLELTRRLKNDPSTRHVRIVAFTAYAMKGDQQKMLEAGCDGYIAKPIEVATFAATVRSLIRPR